jgi:ADP-heptose:LPS heptosyltransferase
MIKLSKNSSFEKILLIVGDRIGDTIFCTPAVRLLKQSLPHVQFDALVFSQGAAQVFTHNPDIHTIHVSKNRSVNTKISQQYPLTINLIFELQKETKYFKIPQKNYLSVGKPDFTKHRALQICEFVNSILEDKIEDFNKNYLIYPQVTDKDAIWTTLKQLGVNTSDTLIGIQLGCHRVARRGWKFWNRQRHRHKKIWDIENYIALAKALYGSLPNCKLVITGAMSERYLATMFMNQVPQAIDLIGKTSVHELAALMDILKVYITHDTGSLHLACARHTPLVTLFADTATPIEFTGPFPLQPQFSIIKKEYLSDISVNDVLVEVMNKVAVV